MKNLSYSRISLVLATALLMAFTFITNSCTDTTARSIEQNAGTTSQFELPQLFIRQGEMASTEEWTRTLNVVNTISEKLKNNPEDFASYNRLCEVYINEARITGEHGYYYPEILKTLDHVLAKKLTDDFRFSALSLKASVLLSQHHFAEAKEIAEQAVKLNPANAQIYGALVDANVELGNYSEAVTMGQKMMDLRPDLPSYTRASYLREIHGDPNGAIEAMNMAVESGFAGYENMAWTRLTLGKIYETYGDIASAETQYKTALAERPGYAFAMAGLASVERKRGNVAEAEKLLKDATAIIPEFSFYVDFASIYHETGRKELAEITIKDILTMMADDEAKGHDMSLEFAKLYLDQLHDYKKALEYALMEYEARPMNIDVNKVLAEIYYKLGNLPDAEKHLAIAMSTNSKNPELLMLAGLITAEADKKAGEQLVNAARKSDPYLDNQFSKEANLIFNSNK